MSDPQHTIEPAEAPIDQYKLAWETIYQQVADEAPLILWMTDSEGNHVYYNRRWYEFTGPATARRRAMNTGWSHCIPMTGNNA